MKKYAVLLLVFALFCFPAVVLSADAPVRNNKSSTPPAQAPVAKPAGDNSFDIVLLMDSSGSMQKTDPHDYRKAAAKLFISLLSENDRVGIISFGDTAKTLIPLTQNTRANQSKLFNAIGKVTSKEFSTHINDAVKKGFEELGSSQKSGRVLVLMSDGKLTLGSEEEDKAAFVELSKLIPEVGKAGIKLYSIAFTDLSDVNLLEDMAKGTGGFFRFVKADKDIHVIFSSMFEKIKSPDSVPLEGENFNIDKDINEAILVITKKSGTSTTLVDPSGKKYTSSKAAKNIKWFGSAVFDMITISAPETGKWKVKLSTQEGNKVFVITNLSLKSSFDKGFVNKGDKIIFDAWLEKDGGRIKEKEVLGEVSFSAGLTGPDGKSSALPLNDSGTSGDSAAGDGVYSGGFVFDTAGEYTIKVIAEGKTFKREKAFQFKVSEKPAQKTAGAPPPEKKAAPDKKSLKDILIKFGIINLALAVVILLAFLIRKVIPKLKARGKDKEKDKKRKKK